MSLDSRLELIEEYVINGVRRFSIRDKKTGLTINVAASSTEEAFSKAGELLVKLVAEEDEAQ